MNTHAVYTTLRYLGYDHKYSRLMMAKHSQNNCWHTHIFVMATVVSSVEEDCDLGNIDFDELCEHEIRSF